MEDRLLELIHRYQSCMSHAVDLLVQKWGTVPVEWADLGMPQSGKLNSENARYYFHGVGCWVTTAAFSVDWDFSLDGSFDGFDEDRLAKFLRFSPGVAEAFPEFAEADRLSSEFQSAIDRGLIRKARTGDRWHHEETRLGPEQDSSH